MEEEEEMEIEEEVEIQIKIIIEKLFVKKNFYNKYYFSLHSL